MENVKPLDSKKWTLSVFAMLLSTVVTAGAVAVGPVAVSALPYLLPVIAGIAIGGVVTQGVQDTKTSVAVANNSGPVTPACPPK
jgi:hypothetical protein